MAGHPLIEPGQRERPARAAASRRRNSAEIDDTPPLARPTSAVRGVGPALAEQLAERGLRTVGDLLLLVPRGYEDRRQVWPIARLEVGMRAAACGQVVAAGAIGGGGHRRYEVAIDDGSAVLRLVYFNFNPRYMRLDYKRGEELWVFGQVSVFRGQRQMAHPEISRCGGADREQGIVPIYSEIAKVPRRTLRRIVLRAVDTCADLLEETIPTGLLDQLKLPELRTAIRHLHRPTDDDDLTLMAEGRSGYHQRLAFDEFFHLQVALAQRRSSLRANPALPVPRTVEPLTLARAILPFELTAAQRRVVDEIMADLAGPQPMARLLQGDVGSGKTAVAAVAALAAVRAGLQVAFLAPTEILAGQHLRTLQQLMTHAGVEVALLTSSTRARERRQLLLRLASGELPLVVGTHALLQTDVTYARLGLVVVDEQHRFGVLQRAALAERGPLLDHGLRAVPHQLVMTATPIPRSLTLTLYGDLALSVLDELPPGRAPIATAVLKQSEGDRFFQTIADELASDGQAFVVYPLVEESEKLDLANATSGAEAMRARFPKAGVTLLTGRMKGVEKEAAMAAFAEGRSRILVATTVVEVGIDVPRASAMVVVNAERFGLSQLHQLRGRVGRGARRSRCLLVHGGAGGADAWRRLKVMEETNDGFRIAEEDLAIRGPGDLLGTRQAGVPTFAFADLMRHGRLLEQARQAAQGVVERDPTLILPEHAALRRALAEQYQTRLALLRGG